MTSQNRLFCIFQEVVSRTSSPWSNYAPTWPPWGDKFSLRVRGGGRGLTAKEGGAGPTLPSRAPVSAPTATSSTWIKQPWNSRQKRKPGQVDVSFFTKFQQEPRHTGYSLVPRTPNTPALTCPHGKPWRQIQPHIKDRGAVRAPRPEYTACWWQRPVRNSGVSDFTAQLLTQLFHPGLNRTEKST